jgi:hypothetical protein
MTVTTSGGVNPVGPSSKDLVVAPDGLTIYEAGTLRQVAIDELVNNPLAIRMVVNDLNQTKQELADVKKGSVPSSISLILAIINGLGVVLVAFGSSYLSEPTPPRGAGWILLLGGGITVLATVGPALLAVGHSLVRWHRRKSSPPSGPGQGQSWQTSFSSALRSALDIVVKP